MAFEKRQHFSYPPVGRCIYCGSTDGLTREHIVPFSFGGTTVLPKASCISCAEITSDFEHSCARTMLGNMRLQLGFPSRNKKNRPDQITLQVKTGKKPREPRSVKIKNLPILPIPLPVFDPPGILSNLQPTDDVECVMNFYWMVDQEAAREQYNKIQPGGTIAMQMNFPYLAFARLLAKIAHSQAVAEYGVEAFSPMLLPYILGPNIHTSYVIGGTKVPINAPVGVELHWLIEFGIFNRSDKRFFTAKIELFKFLKDHPTYWVVLAEADDRLSDLVMNAPLPVSPQRRF
jgi:hypothetical protein